MSSVYFPSWDVHGSCINCPARHGAECWAANCSHIPDYHNSIPEWCPAIPVPEHGRLIDADKIGLTDFEIIMCGGSYKESMKMILEKIVNAPTIIPAKQG